MESASQEKGPELAPGAVAFDSDGDRIGSVRAVYPHYLAVEADGDPPAAYRVPARAVAAVDGATVRLRVQRDALDPMSSERLTAFGLPHHGGAMTIDAVDAEPSAPADDLDGAFPSDGTG